MPRALLAFPPFPPSLSLSLAAFWLSALGFYGGRPAGALNSMMFLAAFVAVPTLATLAAWEGLGAPAAAVNAPWGSRETAGEEGCGKLIGPTAHESARTPRPTTPKTSSSAHVATGSPPVLGPGKGSGITKTHRGARCDRGPTCQRTRKGDGPQRQEKADR